MIKQSTKAADDLATQSIFKKYKISALNNFLLCFSQATKLAQNYSLSTVSVERMVPLTSQEMMFNTVMLE